MANKKIIKECQAIKELISICTPPLLQKIAFNVLKHRDSIIRNNHQIVLQNINSLVRYIEHNNSFFTINHIPKNCPCCFIKIPDMIKDYDFCLKLYEIYNILLTPGECFGLKGYFRLGLGIDSSAFNIAINRIDAFISNYYSK